MLKKDVESSLCIYDKAIRSLPLHTSTQRCDRCTCTHAHMHTHTHQHSDTIVVFSRCVHTHLLSYIQSLQERTNLHSETIAAAIKSMINHICKGTRSTQSTQIFYINVFPMRHCLSSLVETRLCLSPLVETRHCLSSSIKIACTIPSQPTNCTIIISSESKPASKKLHT